MANLVNCDTGDDAPYRAQQRVHVVCEARDAGVEKIVITHPEYWIVNLTLEQQEELIRGYGAILER